jgi:hypothetical protein
MRGKNIDYVLVTLPFTAWVPHLKIIVISGDDVKGHHEQNLPSDIAHVAPYWNDIVEDSICSAPARRNFWVGRKPVPEHCG